MHKLSTEALVHFTAGERPLTPAGLNRSALLARAELRAAARMLTLQFVDTRPALCRSEAFAEDLLDEDVAGLGEPRMRGLAGDPTRPSAGMMPFINTALFSWTP